MYMYLQARATGTVQNLLLGFVVLWLKNKGLFPGILNVKPHSQVRDGVPLGILNVKPHSQVRDGVPLLCRRN